MHTILAGYVRTDANSGQLSQCIRVFGSILTFRVSARIIAAVVLAYTIFTILITTFLCRPVEFFWLRVPPGRCLPKVTVWFFNSAFGVATDIAVAILPLPVVHRLRVPKRQKHLLMVVFALGGAVCIVTCIRFYSLYASATSEDYTWENPQAALYSNIETSVSIIGGCLPTCKTSGLLRDVTSAYLTSLSDNAFVARYFPGLYRRYAGPQGDPFANIELNDSTQSTRPNVISCARTMSTAGSGRTAGDGPQSHRHPDFYRDSKAAVATLSD
jgi:hypothetical protein